MLGRDSARQEYWHFKDDPTRIYIRREEKIAIRSAGLMLPSMEQVKNNALQDSHSQNSQPGGFEAMNDLEQPSFVTPTETKYSWFYYDNDLEVYNLTEKCLNVKGARERALQTSLRTVRDRLKLKKAPIDKALVAAAKHVESVLEEKKEESLVEGELKPSIPEPSADVEMVKEDPSDKQSDNKSEARSVEKSND